jgi:DNA-directed RNA polymerase subunit RPC12/RpoP
MVRRYLLYLIRWQLSTPILAPVIALFKHSPSLFGTREDWIGAAIANLIGGLIFFWVDRFIFTSEKLGTVWQIHENVACVECGKTARGYRLVKTEGYDKTKSAPQFRCEECSLKKSETLRKKGVRID